jgi:putative transposase
MVRFITDHRETYGIEPICAVLPVAPSTYFRIRAQQQDATTRPTRARRDAELRVLIQQIYDANFGVYGPRKVCRQLRREGHSAARHG